jgi:hypothetical protein
MPAAAALAHPLTTRASGCGDNPHSDEEIPMRAAPDFERHPLPRAFIDTMTAGFGDRFSIAEAVRAHHGHDDSHFPDALPDAVVFACPLSRSAPGAHSKATSWRYAEASAWI